MDTTKSVTLNYIMNNSGEWLTVKALAKALSVHPDTIRRWAKSGRIKYIRHPINNYRLFLMSDLKSE